MAMNEKKGKKVTKDSLEIHYSKNKISQYLNSSQQEEPSIFMPQSQ